MTRDPFRKPSIYLLWLGGGILMVGALITMFNAPCSATGFYISAAGAGVTAAACVAMLARSIQQGTTLRWIQFACAVAATLMVTGVASFLALLLCRAV